MLKLMPQRGILLGDNLARQTKSDTVFLWLLLFFLFFIVSKFTSLQAL